MLDDLLVADSGINILATRFQVVVTYIAWFGKTILLSERVGFLQRPVCVELYLTHVQVKG